MKEIPVSHVRRADSKFRIRMERARHVRAALCPFNSQGCVAAWIGISRQAVEQIELRALEKLIQRIES